MFSKINLRSGYHHIQIKNADIPKNTFRARYGHYEYLVISFGVTNAPVVFMNYLNRIFWSFLYKSVVIFIDDILIYSPNREEHWELLRIVLQVLKDRQLDMKLSKCEFLLEEVPFLGHVINKDGISVDPAKVKAVVRWKNPKSVTEVKNFLGLVRYYCDFIEGFSKIALPMMQLTRKGHPSSRWRNTKEVFKS